MRKICLIIMAAVLTVATSCKMGANNQTIAVVNDEKGYRFIAEYPEHKTNKVVAYLQNKLKGDEIFGNADGEKIGNVVLKDGSNFDYEIRPGYIRIDFKKRDNSEVNFQKLTELCMGIKEVLK